MYHAKGIHTHLKTLMIILLIYLGLSNIWITLTIDSVDHQGHITSATLFWRGYFHSFVDHFFQGYVQNLFYPPLNDFLLGAFLKASPLSNDITYKIYLSLIWLFITSSLWQIQNFLTSENRKIVFLMTSITIFLISSQLSVDNQGVSLRDMIFTGLSAQILSFIFLLQLFRSCLLSDKEEDTKNTHQMILWLALCILSHLVTGFIALYALFTYLVLVAKRDQKKQILTSILYALLLTAFFWIPFLAHKNLIRSSNLVQMPSWANLLVLIFFFNWRSKINAQNKVNWPAPAIFLLLLAPLLYYPLLDLKINWPFPSFHYYRFTQFTTWAIFFALIFSRLPMRKIIIALCLLMSDKFIDFEFFIPKKPIYSQKFDTFQLKEMLKVLQSSSQDIERIWTKHLERPIDFSIDSQSVALRDDLNFIKGLFWETSLNNEYISNYIKNLEGPPTIQEASPLKPLSDKMFSCLMKLFMEDMSIRYILLPSDHFQSFQSLLPGFFESPLESQRKLLQTFKSIQDNALTEFIQTDFIKLKELRLTKDINYTLYKTHHQNLNQLSMVETIRPNITIENIHKDMHKRHLSFARQFESRCTNTNLKRDYLIANFNSKDVPFVLYPYKPGSLEKISKNLYHLQSGHKKPTLNLIKLTYLPFWTLKQENKEIPLYESMPGMLAVWSGKAILQFEKSKAMLISYLVSLIALFFYLRGVYRHMTTGSIALVPFRKQLYGLSPEAQELVLETE